MRCPVDYTYLDETGRNAGELVHCTNCGHLWKIAADGTVHAVNATGHIISEQTRAAVVQGPLTAHKARPFIKKQIG